jgi:hypothetical protein
MYNSLSIVFPVQPQNATHAVLFPPFYPYFLFLSLPFPSPKLLNPSPVFLTIFLGNTSTFLLNNPLNSGLITLGLTSSSSPLILLPLSLPALPGLTPLGLPGLPPPLFVLPAVTASIALVLALAPPPEADPVLAALPEEETLLGRCRSFGAGKLDFLSIASTVRWKRRNKASARISVDSRSIVVDNSLTMPHH